MAIRDVRGAIMAGMLTCSLAGITSANARAQQATGLPEKGEVTLVGCLLRERIHHDDKYVLAQPTVGPATSVTEATCSSSGGPLIKLEKVKKHHLETVNVGQWVEVTGDLRKMHKHSDLQDMHVTSFRPVPVVVPRVSEAPPPPEPPQPTPAPPVARMETPAPAPAPAPVGTTGVEEKKHHRLPHSASSLPLAALVGFVALAGGLALFVDRRRTLGRG